MLKKQKKSNKKSVQDRTEKTLTVMLAEGSGRSVQEVEHHLERLKDEADKVDGSAWTFAALAYDGKDVFRMNNEQIAKWVGYSTPRVGEFINTYALFKDSPLKERAKFDLANTARKVWSNFDPAAKKQSSPEAVLESVIKSGASARNFRKALAASKRGENIAKALSETEALLTQNPDLHMKCKSTDCLHMIEALPVACVRLVFFDPPYIGYKRLGIGTYTTGHEDVSGIEMDADNLGREAALKLYCNFIRRVERILVKNGSVAVFLSATTSSDLEGLVEIYRSIDEGGLRIAHELHWLKDRIPPKNFERPFSTQTETVWILCRKDEDTMDCFDYERDRPAYLPESVSLRSNVFSFKTVTGQYLADRKAGRPTEKIVHSFEKPPELAMYLTEKLSLPGELVWDACGCHGNLAIGAIRCGRKILYTESHAARFAEGARRIHRELEASAPPHVEVKPFPAVGNIFDLSQAA